MRTLTLAVFCTLVTSFAWSQNSVWVVYSENKCHMAHLDDLAEFTQDKWGPVMSEVVEDEKWIDWGVLEHAWGNEWNWNIYYVAESRDKFFEGWDLMMKKMSEKYPTWFSDLEGWCSEHKDSMHYQRFGHAFSQDGGD